MQGSGHTSLFPGRGLAFTKGEHPGVQTFLGGQRLHSHHPENMILCPRHAVTLSGQGGGTAPRSPTRQHVETHSSSCVSSEAQHTCAHTRTHMRVPSRKRRAQAVPGWRHLQREAQHRCRGVSIDPRGDERARCPPRKLPPALVIPRSWQPLMSFLCFLSLSLLGFPTNRT